MTTEEFGKTIKEKYPTYSDISDKELGEKMLVKYPTYQDLITKEPDVIKTVVGSQGVLKGITDLLGSVTGTTGLAKGITQSILYNFTPEGKEVLRLANEGKITSEELDSIAGSIATPKEIVGSAAQTGLSIATLGGAGMAGKLGTRIAKTAALGAGFGASSAFGKDEDIKGIAKQTGVGALTGGILPGVGAIFRGVGRHITETLPLRLVRSAVGQSKKALLGGKDISQFVLEKKKIGTARKLVNDSQKQIEQLNGVIQQNFERAPKTVRILTNEVLSSVRKEVNTEGGDISEKEIRNILSSLAPQVRGILKRNSLSLTEANRLRQALDKTLGDRGFLVSQLPFNKDILRMFDNTLREKVKTLAPAGTRELFNELSKEITLRNALVEKIAQTSKNQILSLGDIIGISIGGLAGGLPGGIIGIAGRRIAESTIGKTATAQGLKTFGQGIAPVSKRITPLVRAGILGLPNQ